MLPPDSEQCAGFDTFGPDPSDLPLNLARLQEAIGTPEEEAAWRAVRDVFYCQNRIRSEAAFAAIPHVVPLLARLAPAARLGALVDIGMIEAARGDDPCPDEYKEVTRQALALALGFVGRVADRATFVYLLGAVASLGGHYRLGSLLFQLGSLGGTCPTCGQWVYAEDVQASGYA